MYIYIYIYLANLPLKMNVLFILLFEKSKEPVVLQISMKPKRVFTDLQSGCHLKSTL